MNRFKKLIYDKHTLERKETLSKIDTIKCKNMDTIVSEHFTCAPSKNVNMTIDIYDNIEFWKSIFPVVSKHCQLQGGQHVLKNLCMSPSKDIDILEKRKNIIIEFEGNKNEFVELKDLEQDILHIYDEIDDNVQDIYNMAYFKLPILKRANNCPETLTAYNTYRMLISPMIGLMSPIIYFLVPYLIIIYKFKVDIGFIEYLRFTLKTMLTSTDMFMPGLKYKTLHVLGYMFSMLFYFQGLFNSFELSRTLYKITKYLTEKMNRIAGFLYKAVDLISKHWKSDMGIMYGIEGLKTIDEEVKYVQGLVNKPYNIFTNYGRQLYAYKNLSKDIIQSILNKIYVLDSISGLREFKAEYNYGYTNFIEKDKPLMKLDNIRHPGIEQEKCVANSMTVGPKNVIITGTNAGGKSVFIKSIIINALLSQTCTIGCCDSIVLTPLSHIYEQINVPDMTGHESLFEAEMHRCKGNLECLRDLMPGEHSLIIMDEIFSSTNPLEAISGAYAVCKKMSECENNLLIFTTHFNYLTKLKKTDRFVNYKMETLIEKDDFRFTYKLVPGVNKHYLALEILKKNGFDIDIIEEALSIKEKLMK